MNISHWTRITPQGAMVDGAPITLTSTGSRMLTELYRKNAAQYPKFFKMDLLSRLGWLGSELLIHRLKEEDFTNRAIVLFNTGGSVCNDMQYQATISDADNYFPSPALFVYTLPNIVTGEIAIKNKYYTETSFYLLPHRDDAMMCNIVSDVFTYDHADSVITGWVEAFDNSHFDAWICIVERGDGIHAFTPAIIKQLNHS